MTRSSILAATNLHNLTKFIEASQKGDTFTLRNMLARGVTAEWTHKTLATEVVEGREALIARISGIANNILEVEETNIHPTQNGFHVIQRLRVVEEISETGILISDANMNVIFVVEDGVAKICWITSTENI